MKSAQHSTAHATATAEGHGSAGGHVALHQHHQQERYGCASRNHGRRDDGEEAVCCQLPTELGALLWLWHDSAALSSCPLIKCIVLCTTPQHSLKKLLLYKIGPLFAGADHPAAADHPF